MLDLYGPDNLDWNELLFVGMGNRIKSDDGVGIIIAEGLVEKGIKNVIIAENSIENYLGKINLHPSDTVIIIDAVDQNEAPGFYGLLPISKIINTTSNTHNLSLSTISSFLSARQKWVLAIQPEKVSFGFELSEKILRTAEKIIDDIIWKTNSDRKNSVV